MQARLSLGAGLILVQWCRKNLPRIEPLEKYSPTFKGLKEDRAQGKCYVFAGGSDDTIFHDPRGDWAGHCLYEYRAWHDSVHLQYNLDFSYESELLLAACLENEALAMGMSAHDARLIKLDLQLHIKHYYMYNKHPENQVAMVNYALLYGIDKTLNERVW